MHFDCQFSIFNKCFNPMLKNSSKITCFLQQHPRKKYRFALKCLLWKTLSIKCWNWRMGIDGGVMRFDREKVVFLKVVQSPWWEIYPKITGKWEPKCATFRKEKFCNKSVIMKLTAAPRPLQSPSVRFKIKLIKCLTIDMKSWFLHIVEKWQKTCKSTFQSNFLDYKIFFSLNFCLEIY